MFLDAATESQLTEIRETHKSMVAEYGIDKAVFLLLKWLKDKQSSEPYAIKNNYVFLKLELELVHLIADMEIVIHTINIERQDLSGSIAYRQSIERIDSYIRSYTRRAHED